MVIITALLLNLDKYIGLFLPYFIDYVNQYVSDKRIRYSISLLVPVILAVLLNLQSLHYGNPDEVFVSLAFIFTEAQSVYALYWKRSDLRDINFGQNIRAYHD